MKTVPGVIAGALAGLALSACVSTAQWPAADLISMESRTASCVDDLRYIDRAIAGAGVRDAQATPVDAFPYLRTNRFLSSFAGDSLTGDQMRDLAIRLRALGRESRAIEIANLPRPVRDALRAETGIADLGAYSAECGDYLLEKDLANPDRRAALAETLQLPNHYQPAKRAFGLYPLTAVPVSIGFSRWKRKYLTSFDQPAEDLGVSGRLVAYATRNDENYAAPDIAAIMRDMAHDSLGVPQPEAGNLGRLFAAFSPVWVVDEVTPDDRIGRPVFENGQRLIDIRRPAEFRHISFTRFNGEVLLQLNYFIWFPARPRQGPFDMLGGKFDGVAWRVTLAKDGRPLMYDSIHQCGCYHLFFPPSHVTVKPSARKAFGDDEITVARTAPESGPGTRIVIRLAHTSHYILGLGTKDSSSDDVVSLAADDYKSLRSLDKDDGGRISLFAPDGLVPGSQRKERFFLWPMGIKSAGAMRQWGTHATAFVGHRHFDEPFLFDGALQIVPGTAP